MRHLFILTILLYLTSCGNKEKSTSSTTDTTKTSNDTTRVKPESPTADYTTQAVYDPAFDSMTYISYAGYFPETDEVYISLPYDRTGFEPALDSSVYVSEDGNRQRVSKSDLSSFHLAGLDSITIYNEQHKEMSKGKFIRVDLYDALTTTEYVAIYKIKNFHWNKDLSYYAVGQHAPKPEKDFSTTEFNDPDLTDKLLSKFKRDISKPWIGRHYKVMPLNTVFSILANGEESFLAESYSDNAKIVAEFKEHNDLFDKLLPLPFLKEGKPLMLISAAAPETDIFWDYLAEYKNGEYVGLEFNRVRL